MKRKILTVLLSAALVCATTAILFACGDDEDTPVTYSVTYEKSTLGEEGSLPAAAEYEAGESVTVKGAGGLELNGYHFTGWTDGAVTYQENEQFTMPAKNVKLTATWAEDTFTVYTVTYNLDGGKWTGDAPASSVTEGTQITLPAASDVFRDGYDFAGWQIGALDFAAGDLFTVTGRVLITALWEIKSYTVTFATNVEGIAAPAAVKNTYGTTIDLTKLELDFGQLNEEDYKLVYWIDENQKTYDDTFDIPGSNVTLTAVLREIVESMEITLNGASDYGQDGYWYKQCTVNIPESGYYTFSVEGFELSMYVSEADYFSGENQIAFDDSKAVMCETGPFTLYLGGAVSLMPEDKQDSISGTVIVLKGGSVSVSFYANETDTRPWDYYTVEIGETLKTLPELPESAGEGAGWYYKVEVEDPSGSSSYEYLPFTAQTVVTQNITVFTQWSSATTVTFANGLSNTQEVSYQETTILNDTDLGEANGAGYYTLTLPEYSDLFRNTDSGAFLLGWIVRINNVDYLYYPGEKLDIKAGSSITVIANWQSYVEAVSVNITLTSADSGSPASAVLVNGHGVTLAAEVSGAASAKTGVQAAINVNGDCYYLFCDGEIYGDEKASNQWDAWSDADVTWTKGSEDAYLGLYQNGATVKQVVQIDANADGTAIMVTISSYKLNGSLAAAEADTVLTFEIAVSDRLTEREVCFYFNNNGTAGASVQNARLTADVLYSGNQTSASLDAEASYQPKLWTSVVRSGEEITLTGTLTSSGESDGGLLAALYQGVTAAGIWRMDGSILGQDQAESDSSLGVTVEGLHYLTSKTGGLSAGSVYRAVLKINWLNADKIVITAELTAQEGTEAAYTASCEITPADPQAGFGVTSFRLDLGADSCTAAFTSIVRTAHAVSE